MPRSPLLRPGSPLLRPGSPLPRPGKPFRPARRHAPACGEPHPPSYAVPPRATAFVRAGKPFALRRKGLPHPVQRCARPRNGLARGGSAPPVNDRAPRVSEALPRSKSDFRRQRKKLALEVHWDGASRAPHPDDNPRSSEGTSPSGCATHVPLRTKCFCGGAMRCGSRGSRADLAGGLVDLRGEEIHLLGGLAASQEGRRGVERGVRVIRTSFHRNGFVINSGPPCPAGPGLRRRSFTTHARTIGSEEMGDGRPR